MLFADYIRDDKTNTVTDTEKKLVWQDDANISLSWKNAIKHCEELDFAGSTKWRLPNKKELDSLIDYKRSIPSIDEAFKNIQVYRYWSSSTNVTSTGGEKSAWYVNFSLGHKDSFLKTDKNFVRCVRDAE